MDVLCIYEENSTVIKKKEFLFTKRFRGTIITCYLFHGINNNDIYIYDDMKQFCNHNKQMTCNVKLLHMKNIMEQHNTSIILYFPIMWNNQSHENDLYKNKNIPYSCHFIRFESLYNTQISSKTFLYDDVLRQKICIDLTLTDTCLEKKEDKNIQIFEVIPQCQPDIYYLYIIDNLGNSVFHSVACITTYKLSCEMNFIFRCIQNKNIDWIEESESESESEESESKSESKSESESESKSESEFESEFESEELEELEDSEDSESVIHKQKKSKYNSIHVKYNNIKRIFMKCYYHIKFNKWVPIQVYDR
jgi:hypothetical protein